MTTLELTEDEALVLYEWVARMEGQDTPFPYEHIAEKYALWFLRGHLDKVLVEPFLPNYLELVEQARARIKEKWDGDDHEI